MESACIPEGEWSIDRVSQMDGNRCYPIIYYTVTAWTFSNGNHQRPKACQHFKCINFITEISALHTHSIKSASGHTDNWSTLDENKTCLLYFCVWSFSFSVIVHVVHIVLRSKYTNQSGAHRVYFYSVRSYFLMNHSSFDSFAVCRIVDLNL